MKSELRKFIQGFSVCRPGHSGCTATGANLRFHVCGCLCAGAFNTLPAVGICPAGGVHCRGHQPGTCEFGELDARWTGRMQPIVAPSKPLHSLLHSGFLPCRSCSCTFAQPGAWQKCTSLAAAYGFVFRWPGNNDRRRGRRQAKEQRKFLGYIMGKDFFGIRRPWVRGPT